MLHLSRGEHESHYYSICTALMALGMTIPGIFSGWIQTYLGYNTFYILAAISGIVTLAVAPILYKQIKTT
jgi:PAT family beta-lactamase induction signal transducer AmpG